MHRNTPCPCGSGKTYQHCCERYISSSEAAPTAEALMRSRYSAYVFCEQAYLLDSWHPSTRPPVLDLAAAGPAQWVGLKILKTTAGKAQDTEGRVEFVARYKINGRAGRLHETSRFSRVDGHWFYIGGNQTK